MTADTDFTPQAAQARKAFLLARKDRLLAALQSIEADLSECDGDAEEDCGAME